MGNAFSDDAPLPALKNEFVLEEVLGKGTEGIVYVAHHETTKERCAVKMVDLREVPIMTFKRESYMLSQLRHPCVANVLGDYFTGTHACLVLDYYEGGSLTAGMERHWENANVIPVTAVQNIAKMLLQAVSWLHAHDIVHRDIKCDNFLTDKPDIVDPTCRIYLCDFSTCASCREGQRFSATVGSPSYWAPEVFKKDYSMPADIWAIGVSSFRLLWGQFPVRREEMNSTFRERRTDVPQEGQAFVECMCHPDEAKRLVVEQLLAHAFVDDIFSAAEEFLESVQMTEVTSFFDETKTLASEFSSEQTASVTSVGRAGASQVQRYHSNHNSGSSAKLARRHQSYLCTAPRPSFLTAAQDPFARKRFPSPRAGASSFATPDVSRSASNLTTVASISSGRSWQVDDDLSKWEPLRWKCVAFKRWKAFKKHADEEAEDDDDNSWCLGEHHTAMGRRLSLMDDSMLSSAEEEDERLHDPFDFLGAAFVRGVF